MSDLRVGVIGAGVMGSGIAQTLAQAGYETVDFDTAEEAISRAGEAVRSGRYGFDRAVARGKLREAGSVAAEGVASREGVNQLMVDCFNWAVRPYAIITGATSGWKE